jgi:branched-subunit amino acid aminotransferase/4-amino-4-deoxychorismate lyase
MHKVALFNGKFVIPDDAKIDALSSAALYGRGVFTTIAIYDGEPFLLDKHSKRLTTNADAIGLNLSETHFEHLEQHLRELIEKNSVVDGRARITLFDGSASGIWSNNPDGDIETLIITSDQRKLSGDLNMTVSDFTVNSRSPLAGIKSCNYLDNLLAFEDAGKLGFNEAIRLNERGEVTSACMSNVFWLKNSRLYSPSLSTGCLPGTTREYIIENVSCDEVCVGLDDLLSADAVFITSAGIGIRAVRSINDMIFEQVENEILHLLPPITKTRMSAI